MSEATPLLPEDTHAHLESYEVLSTSSVSSVEDSPLITGRRRGSSGSRRHSKPTRYGLESSSSSTGLEGTLKKRRQTYGFDDLGSSYKVISSAYESLDYDVGESNLYIREERSKTRWVHLKIAVARWLIMFLIGLLTAAVAAAVDITLDKVADWKHDRVVESINHCLEHSCLIVSIGIWVGISVALVFGAAFLVVYLEPIAGGSGIPEIKCYLNGVKVPHVIRFKAIVAKIVGVVGSVGGGLPVGKEGPMIHAGAIIAGGVSQGRSESLHINTGCFRYFRMDHEKRDFVSGGAAAGVAAAFGAPIGGVLFALEEGASFWNQSLTWRIFFCSMTCSFSLNLILSWYHGAIGELSNPGLINFGAFKGNPYYGYELVVFALMGICGGLIGATFNFINFKVSIFRGWFVKYRILKLFEPLLVVTLVVTFGMLLSMSVSECHPNGYVAEIRSVQMRCPDGHYNAMASLFVATSEESIRTLFHAQPGSYNLLTLSLFFIVYFLLACFTYGLSIPSGLFIPCILTGAAFGRFVGVLIPMMFDDDQTEWSDPGKYALIGAAAVLAGVLRMTISLTVIMIEATQDVAYGLPIMVAIITAKLIGDIFNEGIYDIHIQLKSVPLLPWEPADQTIQYSAREIMSSRVKVLCHRETVGRIVDVLSVTTHNGFPVVKESSIPNKSGQRTYGQFLGIILRSQLIILLRNKAFDSGNKNGEKSTEAFHGLRTIDFQDMYPRYPSIHTVNVTQPERDWYVNLVPFMNKGAYTAYTGSSFPHIFKLFRGLGLRHVAIVDEHNQVVGIVTRRDLARYRVGHGQKGMVYKLRVLDDHVD